MFKIKKLAIIGAGASGISAAIEAKRFNPQIDVTVIDRLPKALKKILATGNGRCNFTNEDLSLKHFYGDSDFLKAVLRSSFSNSEGFFREMGVLTYHESGRIYPRSQQASTICDALLELCEKLKINFILDTEISAVSKFKKGFKINDNFYDAVVFACGGKASPNQGSDGSAYDFLKSFGHSFNDVYPALCGITSADKFLYKLKGVRCKCKASLLKNNEVIYSESGEVQFTDKAISGIPVMNLSHLIKKQKDLWLSLDLCEELSENELFEHFKALKSENGSISLLLALNGLVNIKLAEAIIKILDLGFDTRLCDLSNREIDNLCNLLKFFSIKIQGTRDFSSAQISCGGIKCNELNKKTMMSKLQEGLFLCGEVIDIHGDCGGYNLHLAWTTGRIAGFSASQYLS